MLTHCLAASEPARPFITGADGRNFSYGDTLQASARLANALLALGVQPGDRVAAQVEKCAEAIFLYLATLRIGAVFLPLNTAYTVHELDYFIGDAQPRVLVCDPARLTALQPVAARLGVGSVQTLGVDGSTGTLPELARLQSAVLADVPRTPCELAAILYTSGTTGRSKGAMLTHDNLWANAEVLRTAWHYRPDDVLLHALPLFHIHGLFVAVNLTLAAGASLVLLPRFEPDLVFTWLPICNVMMGVPTFYVRLLQDARLRRDTVAHLRLFVSGSAPLLAATHREWRVRTGHAILERYGMTETGMNTSNPYEGERVPGTVGPPLPGVELRVVDLETGTPLPRDAVGMIEVRGQNVFAGYWRKPELSRAEFRDDGYFITGDLGQIDSRGYVHIVGRGKDLIITGGYNVYPREIESELDALSGVVESAVIGLPHPDYGEAVTAVAMVSPREAPWTEAEVLDALKQRLAGYKCPKRVLFVTALPRNAMGKVQKSQLREQYQELYETRLHPG
jgi:malonyl-CoA/methylmalonyl-CoA synthetase